MPVETCDFVVDQDVAAPSALEPAFRLDPRFNTVLCAPFLDAAATPTLHRGLFVPGLSPARTRTRDYCLFVRKGSSFSLP